MPHYEYKVVPAPKRGTKAKGLKGTEDRFARSLEDAMNTMGAEGWVYLRADVLPCEERSGFTGRTTTYQSMLVFQRELVDQESADIHDAAETLSAEALTDASEADEHTTPRVAAE